MYSIKGDGIIMGVHGVEGFKGVGWLWANLPYRHFLDLLSLKKKIKKKTPLGNN